jgi:hypothetical protein
MRMEYEGWKKSQLISLGVLVKCLERFAYGCARILFDTLALLQLPFVYVVIVQQMPLEARILGVLIRAEVTPESPLTPALELHVPVQIILQ